MSEKSRLRIVTYFSPFFEKGLEVCEQLSQGIKPQQTCISFCEDLQKDLEAACKKAIENHKTESDMELAKFAFCAWFDEKLANHTEWSAGYTPLQVIYFSTYNAGNEFFQKLEALSTEQEEVREVFQTSLCLGFVGEHYMEKGPQGKIQKIIDQNSLQIPIPPLKASQLSQEKITPQPYQDADPKPKIYSRPIWGILLACLFLILALSALAYYYMFSGPSKEDILKQVRALFPEYQCAQLEAQIDDQFRVTLIGFLGQTSDDIKLTEQVQNIKGVKSVENQASVYNWPLCEMVLLLDSNTNLSDGSSGNPRIRTQQQQLYFRQGQQLILSATAPDHENYLYIDYLQKDGFVVHLLPIERLPKNKFRPNETLTLGGKSDRKQPFFVVRPPFGEDMLVIYSSPIPLFDFIRPDIQSAEDYFDGLRKAFSRIPQDKKNKLRSDYFIISTTE